MATIIETMRYRLTIENTSTLAVKTSSQLLAKVRQPRDPQRNHNFIHGEAAVVAQQIEPTVRRAARATRLLRMVVPDRVLPVRKDEQIADSVAEILPRLVNPEEAHAYRLLGAQHRRPPLELLL